MPSLALAQPSTASDAQAVESTLIEIVREGEMQVLEVLEATRERAQVGSFEAKEALWRLVGSDIIELTPERTVRLPER